MTKERIAGIDIIKTLAVFFVICVHFSLNTAFYETDFSGIGMFAQTVFRNLFLSCIPLFLMCTGYLERDKELSGPYYLKLLRVLIPYLIISAICLIYRVSQGENIGLRKTLLYITGFTADGYSWYVNMYIGLFLLIPLFNLAVRSMDKKQFLLALGSLIFLISLPLTVNPVTALFRKTEFIRFPDWWKMIYPVLYYFVGAFFAKYPVGIRKAVLIPTVVAIPVLLAGLQFAFSGKTGINQYSFTDYGSIPVLLESAAIFLLFSRIKVKSKPVKKTFSFISDQTLEIYLFSFIADSFIYDRFQTHIQEFDSTVQVQVFTRYFIPIVLCSFSASLLMSSLFRLIYLPARKRVTDLIAKKRGT